MTDNVFKLAPQGRPNIVHIDLCPKCGVDAEGLLYRYDSVRDCIHVICCECLYEFDADCADKPIIRREK
jgi:hypothetical protein